MPETEKMVLNDGKLTIYNVDFDDAGVYYCQIGDSTGGLVSLEITDNEEEYDLVKPPSSNGPYPRGPIYLSRNVLIQSQWSSWSECSRCDRVGRKRRYGPCYVIFQESNSDVNETELEIEDIETEVALTEDIMYLLKAFPNGIPCRSTYLPEYFRKHEIIKKRRNEIMIGLCKMPCAKDKIFKVRNNFGDIIEHVNNSAGVYSLLQPLPAQPPLPARDIIFVPRLHKVFIECPGTTLRDMPLTWKIGTLEVVPRDLDLSSSGRMYISARDQLVITSVKYTDTNLYSCWQSGVLAGSIKLEVWKGSSTQWTHHTTLAAMILVAAVCLRVAIHALNNKRKKITLL